jgi:CRISPR-associated protein Cas5h
MDSLPIVVFRYRGRYGHFRRPYSNVSSLSYPFPPRTAIAGLLGAILGVRKEDVAKTFNKDNAQIAVELDAEVKTVTHVTNFRQDGPGDVNYSIKRPKTDWKLKPLKNVPAQNVSTQIPMELLRNPSYLIYANLNSSMDELISRIKTERYVYTPCMGISEFLVKIEYISVGMAEPLGQGEFDVSTVVSKDDCTLALDHLRPEKGHNIHELKVPHLGTAQRTFTYRRYLVDISSKPLPVRMNERVYQYEDKIITFL